MTSLWKCTKNSSLGFSEGSNLTKIETYAFCVDDLGVAHEIHEFSNSKKVEYLWRETSSLQEFNFEFLLKLNSCVDDIFLSKNATFFKFETSGISCATLRSLLEPLKSTRWILDGLSSIFRTQKS
jgi:hypothetical protein